MACKGILIIVSAPSGTGKGAIIHKLLEYDPNIRYSVSATTRAPRKGEVPGKSYHFLSKEEFEKMIERRELVEWDEYCGHYYGTPRHFIEESNGMGMDVVLDITVAGALNVRETCPDTVMIFVLPPSMEELKRRITARGTEEAEAIAKRLEKARGELHFVEEYEYVVVNDDLEHAAGQILGIIRSERLKVNRNKDILQTIG
ncbi:MAG: guanylate kinase [Clostridia bacterium]